MGNERYEIFITNNDKTKIIEVGPDEAYGSGIKVVYTTEYVENVELTSNVTIIRFNDYYGRISPIYVSSINAGE